jgi:type IV pilus assembly protein PilM
MLRLLTRKVKPIGLDIGHNGVKMIQFAVDAGRVSLIAADEERFELENTDDVEERKEAIISAIKKILTKENFHGREVVSCLPNEQLIVRGLRVNACENEEIESLLKKEVVRRFGLDADTTEVRYMIAGSVQQGDEVKNELILFAANSDAIREHIELLQRAGLTPVAIDTVPCALFRSLERLLSREEDNEVVNVCVDLGDRFTTVVVGRGRNISFVKQIPLGGQKFNNEIATQLGLSPKEATILRTKLRTDEGRREIEPQTRQMIIDSIQKVVNQLAREISLCFKYYAVTFRGMRPGRAIFTGAEAYEDILLDALRAQLAVEIDRAEPLRGFHTNNTEFFGHGGKRQLGCEWAVAVGLSLKGWEEDIRGVEDYERNRLSSAVV